MKHVFILGAGASREAGGPLMSDLLDRAERLSRNKKIDGSASDLVFRGLGPRPEVGQRVRFRQRQQRRHQLPDEIVGRRRSSALALQLKLRVFANSYQKPRYDFANTTGQLHFQRWS
jgi:predicted membrane metal-binding protein